MLMYHLVPNIQDGGQ